jgi:hypothetical protein
MPIGLKQVRSLVDRRMAAFTGRAYLQAKGATERIEAVAQVERAGQVAKDLWIKAVGNHQVTARPHRINHRSQQG